MKIIDKDAMIRKEMVINLLSILSEKSFGRGEGYMGEEPEEYPTDDWDE